MTAYIVQVSLGDLPHGSVGYQTIFVTGLMLFLMTLAFNIAGQSLKNASAQSNENEHLRGNKVRNAVFAIVGRIAGMLVQLH